MRAGGDTRSLSVATSYLTAPGAGGGGEAVAVIAVFSDLTELRELRDTELRMARAAEAQHGRLQDAYREIEERNEALAAALRKVRLAQGLGAVLVLGLFLGAGLWSWGPLGPLDSPVAAVEPGAVDGADQPPRTLVAAPRPVSSTISLKGRLAPWRTLDVRSPVEATVAEVGFRTGQEVSEGQRLVELDLTRLRQRHQKAQLLHSKARKAFDVLERWDDSAEMSSARRTFLKAKLDMEREQTTIKKKTFLFEHGLISTSDYEDAKRRHRSQQLDFEAAEQELAAARAKGGEEELAAARLELEAAKTELGALEADLQWTHVSAPLTGVVLAPARSGGELVTGRRVRRGDKLLRIGDYSRMNALARADEVDVGKLRVGQEVAVTGNAFRGLRLKGVVSHVSSQADPRLKRAPMFDVVVTLDPLREAERTRLRDGMSARLTVVVYRNPKALLVPIDAVSRRGRSHRLRVLDPGTGKVVERKVEVGHTTLRRVEVTAGLAPGERVVLPSGS